MHGKHANWKPSSERYERKNRENIIIVDINAEFSLFTKEQIEVLQKMFSHVSNPTPAPQFPIKPPTSLFAHQGTPSLLISSKKMN